MPPRLFLPPGQHLPPAGEPVALGPAQAHYLRHVLRLRSGDRVVLLDRGGGAAGGPRQAAAALLGDGRLLIEGVEEVPPPARLQVTLLLGLLKGERMDWAIEKATELGAAHIVPVACARSVRRIDPGRAGPQAERWRRIATAAAQQSRRPDVPEVAPVHDLPGALRSVAAAALRLLPWEGAAGGHLGEALPQAVPAAAAVLIGPEGGLAEDEVEAATLAGFVVCGLGPRILRAETAALCTLGILMDWAERPAGLGEG